MRSNHSFNLRIEFALALGTETQRCFDEKSSTMSMECLGRRSKTILKNGKLHVIDGKNAVKDFRGDARIVWCRLGDGWWHFRIKTGKQSGSNIFHRIFLIFDVSFSSSFASLHRLDSLESTGWLKGNTLCSKLHSSGAETAQAMATNSSAWNMQCLFRLLSDEEHRAENKWNGKLIAY